MMTLHWSPRSPFVRKVMIVAHELALADRLHCIRTVVGGTTPHLALMRDNPLGKLPTLVLEDGSALYDSPVICEYLDSLHDGERLYPAGGPARLVALRRQALGDGMLDIGLQCLGERVRQESLRSVAHMAFWLLKLRACVDALEQEAGSLTADRFDIGHLTVGVALGYLDFRYPALSWRDGHPRLAAWHATFEQRAAVRANLPRDDS